MRSSLLARSASVLLVLATASACAAAETTSVDPSSSAGPDAALVALVADYNERNNRAIQAAHGSFDAGPWAGADTGLILAGDQFDTRLAAVLDRREPSGRYDYHLARAVGAGPSGHPTWVVFLATTTSGAAVAASVDPTAAPATSSEPNGSPAASPATQTTAAPSAASPAASRTERPEQQLVVFEQSSPQAPWLMSFALPVDADLVPASAAGTPVGPAELRNATELGDRIRGWLQTGTVTPGVALGPDVARVRDELAAREVAGRVELDCSLLHGTWVASGISDGVRSVRLADGRLDAVSVSCTKTLVAARGQQLSWNAPYDRLFPGGPGQTLSVPYGIEAVVWARDGATPVVLALRLIPLLSR